MLCPDGFDDNGCKNADRCLPRGNDVNGNLCPEQCPPVCGVNQERCSPPIKENGCRDAAWICLDKIIGNDGSVCKLVCPITCSGNEVKIPGGIDSNGCPMDDICSGKLIFNT